MVTNFARNCEAVLNSGEGRSFLAEDDLVDGSSQISSALLVSSAVAHGVVSSALLLDPFASSFSALVVSGALVPGSLSGFTSELAFAAVLGLHASLSPGKMSLSSFSTDLGPSSTSGIVASHTLGASLVSHASLSPGSSSGGHTFGSGFSALLVSGALSPGGTSGSASLSPSGHSLSASSGSALLGFVALSPGGPFLTVGSSSLSGAGSSGGSAFLGSVALSPGGTSLEPGHSLGSAVLVLHAFGNSSGTLGSLLLSPGSNALRGSSALSPPASVSLLFEHASTATLVFHATFTIGGTSLASQGTSSSPFSSSLGVSGTSGGSAFLGLVALKPGGSSGGSALHGSSALRFLHASGSPGGTSLFPGGMTLLSSNETGSALRVLHASSSAGRSSLEVFSTSGSSALLGLVAFSPGSDSLHSSLLSGLFAFGVLGAFSVGGNSGLVLLVSGPAFLALSAFLEPGGTSLQHTASAAASSSVSAEVVALLLFAFAFLGSSFSHFTVSLFDLTPVIGNDVLHEHFLDDSHHLLGSTHAGFSSFTFLGLSALSLESSDSGSLEAFASGSGKTIGTLLPHDTFGPGCLPSFESSLSTVDGGLLDPVAESSDRVSLLLALLLELSNVGFGSIDCDAGSQDGKGEGSHGFGKTIYACVN